MFLFFILYQFCLKEHLGTLVKSSTLSVSKCWEVTRKKGHYKQEIPWSQLWLDIFNRGLSHHAIRKWCALLYHPLNRHTTTSSSMAIIEYGNNFFHQTTAPPKGLTTWHSPTPCLTLSSLADPSPTTLLPYSPHTIGLIITLIVEQKHKSKISSFLPISSLNITPPKNS